MREGGDAPRLVLDRSRPPAARPPRLDDDQAAVVAHDGGPLLVLAGPGTGKTTTLVEAMVSRLAAGAAPTSVLGLTFGRRAAAQWRDRVVARTGGGVPPTVVTFHSFAYALVRSHQPADAFTRPLRLLSGAEQESRLRELLGHAVAEGRVPWPPDLAEALGTRGLAGEVRAVVARARALGLDPADLEAAGAAAGQPAWESIGRFTEEYLDVLDAEGVTDYTELMLRAVLLAEQPDVGAELRARFRAVYVDEYQDTDPMQVRLLRALVDPTTTLVAVGDPDQAIYGFRGADVGGLLGFRDQFRDRDGAPARLAVLGTTRRFGPTLRSAATAVLGDRVPHGLSAAEMRRHRAPACVPGPMGDGVVEVRRFDDEGAQAAHVADLVRRSVLASRHAAVEAAAIGGDAAEPVEPLDWSDVAVLVRSGVRQIPALRRALSAAGVPVEVAGDELPLRDEPAVAPLLAALRWAIGAGPPSPELARRLLLSPLGGVDAADLRRLGRELRRAARAADPGTPPPPSDDLVAAALADPRLLLDVDASRARAAVGAARRLAGLLATVRTGVAAGASPADALWWLWDGTGWPGRLERVAWRGGAAGRRADHDLDAVLALFDVAERAAARGGVKGVGSFLAELADQEIPAETLAERGCRGSAVRLLTAHRSKGLEWRLVVVVGVQEGAWPDLRRRGTVLAADRLGPEGLVDPPRAAELLAEERRLFYVACTRARQRLVVAAVEGPADDPGAAQPSRFLADLAGADDVRVHGRPQRSLSLPALVAGLRRASVDPAASPALRRAAARRLAVLASDAAGPPVAPAAHPDRWWGLLDPTPGTAPVRPPDQPLALSGSAVAAIHECPLRWFLSREARGESPRTTALGFGSLVHALADAVARGVLPADLDVVDAALGRVWGALGYEAAWQSDRERAAARDALARFLVWHAGRERALVATEWGFDVEREVPGPDGARHVVRLRGAMDVVEIDVDGAIVVSDLKTGAVAPRRADVERHPQLGVYQAAVASGAAPESARPGGAALVMLRLPAGAGSTRPKVLPQPPLPAPDPPDEADEADSPDEAESPDEPTWIDAVLGAAAALVRAEDFAPTPGLACRTCPFRVVCPARPEGAAVVP